MPTESELPPGKHRNLLEAVHDIYRKAGCPGTRRISSTAAEATFAADVISHQAVANILNGKSFPIWVKLQAMMAALLIIGRSESINTELERFRSLWVDAHYGESGFEAPIVPVVDESLNHLWSGNPPPPAAETPKSLSPSAPDLEATSTAESDPEWDAPDTSAAAPESSSNDGQNSEEEDFGAVFATAAWTGPDMFSVKRIGGRVILSLNIAHPMGNAIAEAVERDEETARTLWLLLFSWVRMEDEIPSASQRSRVEDMRRDWSRYAGLFIGAANEVI
ncbi:hypothetical protein [Streptomyces ureilyticus]|uniref:Uncharacterized protein n=1 Tax=Streptomyces ureilyticus TaxID=1775131 RepID=A0ABX0E1D4_9ACTN|nr:hypothetical protein [Streptomyces ureilyticus]NGO45106.1 hypothetical protein [Streptomyces ureilyticus]